VVVGEAEQLMQACGGDEQAAADADGGDLTAGGGRPVGRPRLTPSRPRQRHPYPQPPARRDHSLFGYAALHHPEHAASIQRVLAVPPKRFERNLITYLTDDEVDALLTACNRGTWTGR
jgi:hypothetical protein